MSQQEKTEIFKLFPTRLKDIRMRMGLSQADFARKVGITPAAVSNWESGANLPSNRTLSKISASLSFSVDFLLGKDPEPPAYPVGNVRIEPLRETSKLSIPVVSWASAGTGGNFSDMEHQIEERIECDCSDPNAYALIIQGDSMLPKFEPGDRVVFLPNSEPRNGDVVVARLKEDGDVLLKMYHRSGTHGEVIRLTSYNPVYPPLEFPSTAFRFIHPMHGMWRPRRR